jgi:hypothetical protein
MSAFHFLTKLFRDTGRRTRRTVRKPARKPPRCRLTLDALEERSLLSASFGPPVTLPVGVSPESTVTADLGNGHQDIVVLNHGLFPDRVSSVSVLLGNGDGTFAPAITTSLLPGATSVAVGDFNRDGKPDLAITSGLTDSVEILQGNGDGTFGANPLIIPVGTQQNFSVSVQSVAVGDFLHNGKLDLAVANPGSNTVSVLLGNGDGTFGPRADYAVGTAPLSVAALDLGNGQVDLVVANHDSSNVSVLVGNGDGSFGPAHNIDVTTQVSGFVAHPLTLQAGDFNGDGKPDVLISQFAGADAGESLVTLLPGNGDGTFGAPITRDAGFGLIGLAVADFDADGNLDFAMSEAFGVQVEVFPGNGDGTFGTPGFFHIGNFPSGPASGDFNGDGRPDLAAPLFANTVSVLLNTSGEAAATTTTLNTSVPSAVFGQAQTLTATVNSSAGTPTGSVTFFDGNTALGSAPLNAAGQATLTVALGVGNHVLTASFGGSSAMGPSTSTAVVGTVSPAATAVALSASTNPVRTGAPVTFTATVTAVAPGAGTPTGTVTFFDGSTVLGTATVNANGQATLTRSFATVGSHTIKAAYSGDGNFTAGAQTITEQVVARRSSHTTLVASANPVALGQSATFTATVSAASGTGTVTFTDGSVVLAVVTLHRGKATLAWRFTTVGGHPITAAYSGDANFTAGSQDLIEQVH